VGVSNSHLDRARLNGIDEQLVRHNNKNNNNDDDDEKNNFDRTERCTIASTSQLNRMSMPVAIFCRR
jgi:hypothetical protein